MTQKKKRKRKDSVKLHKITYPQEVFVQKPYIVEIFEQPWRKLNDRQKNLFVWKIMCSIPDGGFDPASKYYAKEVKPQIMMHDLEYAVTGGVVNWLEDDRARDPMEVEPDDVTSAICDVDDVEGTSDDDDGEPVSASSEKHPVTADGIASV